VSSREQEREGFSLDVQEDAFHAYAKRHGGVVDKMFRIAETATKHEQRKIFREAIDYAKRHAHEYAGMLFYKIDRAARNLKDLVLLEEIEKDYGLPFISVTQPVDNTPTGRMVRRTLATIGAFQTEQQALDIQEGIAKRVALGWFPNRSPYGYRNLRLNGRAIAEIHPENGLKVLRAFELRASERLLVEELVQRLYDEGLFYTPSKPRFSVSKMHAILGDLSYLGFVRYKGSWHPGLHEPLVDKTTWDLVRVSFGEQRYRSHQLVYGGELIRCGFCGHPVTGEEKEKPTKAGPKTYIYYRCARYQRPGHPRIRLRESEIDAQIEAIMADFQVSSPEIEHWTIKVAVERLRFEQASSEVRSEEVKRQLSLVEAQKDELLNLRLGKTITEEKYVAKQHELTERETLLRRRVEINEAQRAETEQLAKLAPEVFRLARQNWATMDRASKHRTLQILFGGFVLQDGVLATGNGTPLELFRVAAPCCG
jgi:DNA invertase Pin-like site-specific DNA recombinase